MGSPHEPRNEAALYWSAVSLIVCQGLSIEKAAERLEVESDKLREILHRRQALRPFSSAPNRTVGMLRQ